MLTEYESGLGLPIAFLPEPPAAILADVMAAAKIENLRVAETEKYAHVTYFFNGGREEPSPGEERVLIASPRHVATYDLQPEMSANDITDALLAALEREDYRFVLVNYANPDMVGHTGVIAAAVRAVETIDRCLERLCGAVLARAGQLLITADHGNVELLIDPDSGEAHTAHTTNPVPLFWVGPDTRGRALRSGGLADIAPSLCHLLGLPTPKEMTGQSLFE